jgi:hypothetical protein
MHSFFQRIKFSFYYSSAFKLRNKLCIGGILLSFLLVAMGGIFIDSWELAQLNKINTFPKNTLLVRGINMFEDKFWLTSKVPPNDINVYYNPINGWTMMRENKDYENNAEDKLNINLVVGDINFRENFPLLVNDSMLQTMHPIILKDMAHNQGPALYISYATAYRLFGGPVNALNRSIVIDFYADGEKLLPYVAHIAFTIGGVFSNSIRDEEAFIQEKQNGFIPMEIVYTDMQSYKQYIEPQLNNISALDINAWIIKGDIKCTDEIKTRLKSNKAISVYSFEDMLNDTYIQSSGLRNIQLLITVILLAFAGANMINIVSFSIKERSKEIAVRRILGATKKQIMVQVCMEMLLLSLIGSIFGALISIAASYIIYIAFYTHLRTAIDLVIRYETLFSTTLIVIASTVIFSILPAAIAASTPLTDALHEDL